MAVSWSTPAGDLGILEERITIDIPLTASTTLDEELTFEVIAGRLPAGLQLLGNRIKGTPGEVTKFTESRFVVRASDSEDEKDRTFKLSVDGSDVPEWVTEGGFLNVGSGEAYFVLDDAQVDFQLEARDNDVIAGDVLEFYLVPNSGELPPGLSMSKTGRITGFTKPVNAVAYSTDPVGAYDTQAFDTTGLDIAKNNSTGFDTYIYDTLNYDYSEKGVTPKKLSRIYTFSVAVTDGVNNISRAFKIYVVTEEFLQADNTLVQVDTNLFQADSSRDRTPLWITDSYLGRYRANNYLTLVLDVYDPPSLSGTIIYFILDTNPDGSPSVIPPGLVLDNTTGEIAGTTPYQAAVTKQYQFTMQAINYPITLADTSYTLVGDWNSRVNYFPDQAVRFLGQIWIANSANRGEIPGTGQSWNSSVSTSEKTFKIDLIGEIESALEWETAEDLGSIKPNQPSTKSVSAKSLLYGGRVAYSITQGVLPPGLEFLPTGIIQGKVRQFADSDQDGLTRFYEQDSAGDDQSTLSRDFSSIFDGGTTSYDKVYTFTVKAQDGATFSESEKEFKLTVIADNEKTFANLYARAFPSKEKRLNWFNFITDSSIFKSDDIYRYGDKNYGIQTDLQCLLFAGIESREAVKYVQAISRNHYDKRFAFGNLNIAKGKDPVTQETLYEVIYVDLLDNYEKNGKSISQTIELDNEINSKVLVSYQGIRIDSDIPLVSDSDVQKVFPNSVRNMRERISAVGDRDREFLPLWMRSIQDNAQAELGYTKALVLCYAKPGRADAILSRIRSANFDFKLLDFVADRYVIDIVDGEIQDQYLKFPQKNITNHRNSTSVAQNLGDGDDNSRPGFQVRASGF